MVDGEPCTDGTNCCSRVCADIPGGGKICQLASGCRVIGDICTSPTDCCGGPGVGTAGAGNATCTPVAGTDPPVGTCSNPNSCDPEGDVCGLSANARHDCCDCAPPKIDCCKPDSSGVPRCYGTPSMGNCPNGYTGATGCCIATGDICAFDNECCNGAPCLPDGTGVLRCGTTCVMLNGTCTATADCCTGLICNVPPGSPSGTCENPPTPDAGPGSDAGTCAEVGQTCGDAVGGITCCGLLSCTCPPIDAPCTCTAM
jgi:hypothetical protein